MKQHRKGKSQTRKKAEMDIWATPNLTPTREEYEYALMIVAKYEEAQTEAKIRRNSCQQNQEIQG